MSTALPPTGLRSAMGVSTGRPGTGPGDSAPLKDRKENLAPWLLTKALFTSHGRASTGYRWLRHPPSDSFCPFPMPLGRAFEEAKQPVWGESGRSAPCCLLSPDSGKPTQGNLSRVLGSSMGKCGRLFDFNSSHTNKKSILTSFQRTSRG